MTQRSYMETSLMQTILYLQRSHMAHCRVHGLENASHHPECCLCGCTIPALVEPHPQRVQCLEGYLPGPELQEMQRACGYGARPKGKAAPGGRQSAAKNKTHSLLGFFGACSHQHRATLRKGEVKISWKGVPGDFVLQWPLGGLSWL